jgi:hypothetical protein
MSEWIRGNVIRRPVSDGLRSRYPIVTIEHVLPQTPNKGSKWLEWFPEEAVRDAWVHRLANLVLLRNRVYRQLEEYCGLDTEGMWQIISALRELV